MITSAEIVLPSKDIAREAEFWDDLGFRMDQIYPADDPQIAALSGHGLHLRLDKTITTAPGTVRLLCRGKPDRDSLVSPSGTRVEFVSASIQFPRPPTQHAFATRRLKDNAPWVIGRAGMHYRDLIPSRLGGAIIASHIRIPDAGPVPDKVHYHEVGFQLIFCISGWVRLVYEDQGPPFILAAGDCVIQPPQIRHRVLESSENLQVVEVGVPAEHLTTMDYEMELPTSTHRPDREWEGQRFVHSLARDAVWRPWRIPGFEARDTGIGKGTRGVASVQVARPVAGNHGSRVITSHDSDILLTFVLAGSCTLHSEDGADHKLTEGDAYTLPPGNKSWLADLSDDLNLLEVSLPADFQTTVHPQQSPSETS
ncbi:hypothetical protein M409DRAFT_70065 [Zasmidium cellare ATCC 36951]|uniref:Cupin type-2 domain-containing protein n=1 Tax=Zasmidium cellare ATCC 36951 TaxID=1080233 RepID=A0A6A6C6J0_ZASCE|nr:uncharacterized protein M409DRAFT_70065 [Zasmidium cellare ATCC 36951]KAF2160986.1 hypothetical protein M409DRAFT_70065 [Zasmidium cellare ATCC 36951]